MKNIFKKQLIKGLIISYSDDEGPKAIINLSNLNETLAIKLSLIGMTILMFGNENPTFYKNRYYKIYGPIPVPSACVVSDCSQNSNLSNELDSLAIIFNLENDLPTNDDRTVRFGKDVLAWLLIESVDRLKIIKEIENIEKITDHYLKEIKFLSELSNEDLFSNLFKDLNNYFLNNLSTIYN